MVIDESKRQMIYISHPVAPEVLEKYSNGGFIVVDAIHAPANSPYFDGKSGELVVPGTLKQVKNHDADSRN